MENIKYWYFRFKKEFLSNEAMRNMKHEVNGYVYIVIYIELSSLSLETGGYIRIRKSPEALQTKYVIDLASDIGEDPKILSDALVYFLKNKLVEMSEDLDMVNIYVPYVGENIGHSSSEADRIKRLRQNQKDRDLENTQEVLPDPGRQEKELLVKVGVYKNVYISKNQLLVFKTCFLNHETLIENLSISRKELAAPPGIDTKSDYDVLKERGRRFGRRNREAYAILLERAKAGAELPEEACDIVTEQEYENLLKITEKNKDTRGDNG